MPEILIVGAGYLSRFLIPALRGGGFRVTATSRSPERCVELERAGATAKTLHLDALESADWLGPHFDAVIYSAAAGRGGDRELVFSSAPRRVLDRVASSRMNRFILTSSIGVYHREDGSWVDENSEPDAQAAKTPLLAGESALPCAAVSVLRLAGLYGPSRSPVSWMQDPERRARIAKGHPNGYVNWVRIEDVVEAILQVLHHRNPARLYNVVDDEPAVRQEFYDLACTLGGSARLELAGRGSLGKRVSNARLKSELDWRPRFPSYREGLADLT
ncbi:MAG: NAD(P)H-binding protein [Myxococcota bacterium]